MLRDRVFKLTPITLMDVLDPDTLRIKSLKEEE
jgi:hypothetical protein